MMVAVRNELETKPGDLINIPSQQLFGPACKKLEG